MDIYIFKLWLHLRFPTLTGNWTSSKLVWTETEGVARISRCPQYLQHCSSDFAAESAPWLPVQHFGFTIPATSDKSFLLPVRIKLSHV